MDISVFSDLDLKIHVLDGFLLEGETYFADLSAFSPSERSKLIEDAKLVPFGSRQFENSIWEFKIDGFIGNVDFGGQLWDVRSKKLNVAANGSEQFLTMLGDIETILGRFTFHYGSPASSDVVKDSSVAAFDLQRLEYLQRYLKHDSDLKSIESLLNILKVRKNSKIEKRLKTPQNFSKGKLASKRFAKNVGKPNHVNLHKVKQKKDSHLQVGGKFYKIVTFPTVENFRTIDTAENRFIKFILKDFEALCLRILSSKNVKLTVENDTAETLRFVRSAMNLIGANELGALVIFPSHSSVLTKDFVYAGLYEHFLRSKYGRQRTLEELQAQAQQSSLKDISSLYEIWCFAKIVDLAFSQKTEIKIDNFNRTSGVFSNGCKWSCDDFSIYFNKTFSKNKNSYSLSLRPDVVVERTDSAGNTQYFHFDAKYKLDSISEDVGGVKSSDIHKMHTYVDAISNSVCSIALYPGTEVKLFCRNISSNPASITDIVKYGGVGALPFVPQRGQKSIEAALEVMLSGLTR